jgi:Fe-S oxidoreductase
MHRTNNRYIKHWEEYVGSRSGTMWSGPLRFQFILDSQVFPFFNKLLGKLGCPYLWGGGRFVTTFKKGAQFQMSVWEMRSFLFYGNFKIYKMDEISQTSSFMCQDLSISSLLLNLFPMCGYAWLFLGLTNLFFKGINYHTYN